MRISTSTPSICFDYDPTKPSSAREREGGERETTLVRPVFTLRRVELRNTVAPIFIIEPYTWTAKLLVASVSLWGTALCWRSLMKSGRACFYHFGLGRLGSTLSPTTTRRCAGAGGRLRQAAGPASCQYYSAQLLGYYWALS